LKGRYINHLN